MSIFAEQMRIIAGANPLGIQGRVASVSGLTVVANDLAAPVGATCRIVRKRGDSIRAQVVGFQGEQVLLMPLMDPLGVGKGDVVEYLDEQQGVRVGDALLGRVVNGMGEAIDGKGPLRSQRTMPLSSSPPDPLERKRIDTPLSLGIRSLDALTTLGQGQRIGVFAGTGVGKSVLMGMITRNTEADVCVVALIGERGREVGDFIARDLGEEGLAKSVMVVSTSDQSPVLRVRACSVATTIAEYFRDRGKRVLLLMDSLTRVAMAQRQIGLAAGEPPTTRGYPPSAFSILPQLLERSGQTATGSITGIYTVLVEADDINDPVADAVRGVLDGHIWLSRGLAERGHYPAVDVLGSISRVMPDVVDEKHMRAAQQVKRALAVWRDIEDLVNIGAYAKGNNPEYDLALEIKPKMDAFLQQDMTMRVSFDETVTALQDLVAQISALEKKLRNNGKAAMAAHGK